MLKGHTLNRRTFLKTAGTAFSLAALPQLSCIQKVQSKQPNFLIIITDQQSSTMLSCAGNKYLKTPAMDSLAASGIRFDRAYCTNPVCSPSRFSLMTSRMPSEISMRSNSTDGIQPISQEIKQNGLGYVLKNAGYDVAYGGKVHLPKMDSEDVGFEYLVKDERDELAQVCTNYLQQEHNKPFLLVASFINPHDICYMAIRDSQSTDSEKNLVKRGGIEIEALDKALQKPKGVSDDEFVENFCPPLPENFEPQIDEPEAIRWLLNQRPFRVHARENWSPERWREHRWAYCRLTEMVDAQIGIVLDALKNSGKADETIVIFTSDHGDMDSSHRMEHKTAFYDQASRIPFIVSGPGISSGVFDKEHLVSNGLDLIPTLCDYAGAAVPENLQGKSLRSILEGKKPASWRTAVPVESEIGKMIVTQRYKYMVYDEGKNEEQFLDMEKDPLEMQSVTNDTASKTALDEHRKLYQQFYG